jgi:protein TonB
MTLRIPLLVVGALLWGGSTLAAQNGDAAEVMAASAVEQPPALVPGSCQALVYPPTMRAARMEGRVVLQFVVDTLGRVEPSSVQTIRSTHRYFEDAARRSLLTCRYQPARFNSRPVRVTIQTPISFQLARG